MAISKYSGADVFNAIRNSTPSLQSRYPEASAENLKTIGYNIARDNINIKMDYLDGLLKMVSAIFVKSNTINNPLSELIKGGEYYAFGDLIENIKVHIAKGVSPKFLTENLGSGKTIDPFIQNQPKTVTEFFQSNLPLQYLVTISEWQLQRAFESAQGMGSLISAILESITNGMNTDLFEAGKSIMNAYINDETHTLSDGQVMETSDVTNETTGKEFILNIKNLINSLQFPTSAFNPAKIVQTSNSDTLTMYVRPGVMNNISVNTLAGAFNRDDLDLTPIDGTGKLRIKTLPDFGGLKATKTSDGTDLTVTYDTLGSVSGYKDNSDNVVADADITWVDPNDDVLAIIAAPDAFGIALRKQNYSPIYNPRGDYLNYWYNMEYWCYYSNLENVIIIKKSKAA